MIAGVEGPNSLADGGGRSATPGGLPAAAISDIRSRMPSGSLTAARAFATSSGTTGRPIASRCEMFWSAVFGVGRAPGRVTRLSREVEAMRLIERVGLGEITSAQYERMTAFDTANR